MSGKRGSNPRPSAWEADALPTELLPRFVVALAAGGQPEVSGAKLGKIKYEAKS